MDDETLATLSAMSQPDGVTVVALVDQTQGLASALPEHTVTLTQQPSLKSLRRLLQRLELGVGGPRASEAEERLESRVMEPRVAEPYVSEPYATEPTGAVRVLLVEDNVINQMVAQTMLEQLGAYVRLVVNGQEALDAVRAEDWDLVLMDCEMPVMNGFLATREIRAWERGTSRHVPIIALTANAMEDQRNACLAAGMDAHIAKPVGRGDLAAVVQRYARRPLAAGR